MYKNIKKFNVQLVRMEFEKNVHLEIDHQILCYCSVFYFYFLVDYCNIHKQFTIQKNVLLAFMDSNGLLFYLSILFNTAIQ